MSEQVMIEHRLRLLQNVLILECFTIPGSKEIVRTFAGSKMIDYPIQRLVFITAIQVPETWIIAINE